MSSTGDHSPRKSNTARKVRKNGEGTVYFDNTKQRFVAEFFDIKGERQKSSFNRQAEAIKWLENNISIRDHGHGTHAEKPKQTVKEYLDDWLEHIRPTIRYNTYRCYKQAIRCRINPYIGDIRLSKLKGITIEKMFNDLIQKGYKGGTIDGVYRTLSKAFNDGVRLDLIPFSPLQKVRKPRIQSTPSTAIPKSDLEKLLREAAKNPADLARLVVGAHLGLRPGEISGLRWSDLDEENLHMKIERQVQYEPKLGHVYRPLKINRKDFLPITEIELNILKRYKTDFEIFVMVKCIGGSHWKGDSDIMFPNKYGNLQNAKSDRIWLNNLCDRAGTPRYERYQLRKTAFTSLLLSSDIGTVMAYSGHTQSSTLLKHYISPELTALRGAIAKRENSGILPDLDFSRRTEQ